MATFKRLALKRCSHRQIYPTLASYNPMIVSHHQRHYRHSLRRVLFKSFFGTDIESKKENEIKTLNDAVKRINYLEKKLMEKEALQDLSQDEDEDPEREGLVINIHPKTAAILSFAAIFIFIYGLWTFFLDISKVLQITSDKAKHNLRIL